MQSRTVPLQALREGEEEREEGPVYSPLPPPLDTWEGAGAGGQGGEAGDKSLRKLQVEPLEQGGEEQKHLHPGKLLAQAVPSSWRDLVL